MHYYQFNIGDYKSHTDYLTPMEDLAFRRMLDLCYLHEKPLPSTAVEIARRIGLRDHVAEVELILTDFFVLTEKGYENLRANEEIEAYQLKAESARQNGKRGGRPRKITQEEPKKTQSVNLANPTESETNPAESESKAKHKPLTIKHKTINNIKDNSTVNACAVNEVFDHWVSVMGKPINQTKLTPKREKAIKDRLKDGYEIPVIKRAIENCSRDRFYMGDNDRGKAFNDIELICRSGEKLESFLGGQVRQQSKIANGFDMIDGMDFSDLTE